MNIEETKTTPRICVGEGMFEIKGKSIPEDPFALYSPLMNEVHSYVTNPSRLTIIRIHLEYVNSGSKKYITNLFTRFDDFFTDGNEVITYWYFDYEDEAIQELGEDLRSMVTFPFNMIEVR